MTSSDIQREQAAEARVGRHAFVSNTIIVLAIWVVSATSVLIKRDIEGVSAPWLEPWILEGTSLLIAIPLFFMVRWFERQAPIGTSRWPRILAVHALGSLVFCTLVISWMAVFRAAVWPPLFGHDYALFGDNPLQVYLYEFRKLLAGYLGPVILIYFIRQLEMTRLELDVARNEARSTQRLTLKCGGRVMRIEASGFQTAKAAGNYVEVRTETGEHLARMTLAELEKLLTEAGIDAVRVHRSWLVNRDHITEITPNGEGDVVLTLTSGERIPGSRRYRDRLAA